jgi:hypothetical protein
MGLGQIKNPRQCVMRLVEVSFGAPGKNRFFDVSKCEFHYNKCEIVAIC